MTDPAQPKPTKYTLYFGLPGMSATLEGEFLAKQAQELRENFTPEKRQELLEAIWDGAGNSDTLKAQAEFNYYLTVMQVNSSERGARQAAFGTWVLAVATVVLAVATIVLVFVTASHG